MSDLGVSLTFNLVDRLTGGMRNIQASVGRVSQAFKTTARSTADLDKELEQVNKRMQNAAFLSLAAGRLEQTASKMRAGVRQNIDAIRPLEKALGELRTVDVSNVDLIATRGLQMQKRFAGITASAYAEAAYDIKSGISTLTDQGVADLTAAAAVTAKATKAQVGQMTSLFATGYGIFKRMDSEMSDADWASKFSAGLAASVKQFKTTGSEMQMAIERSGAGLTLLNVPLQQQLALLGMLQQTMGGQLAGTAVKIFAAQAGKAQQAFDKLGYSIDLIDADGKMAPLADFLTSLQDTFGTEWNADIADTIKDAFGTQEAVNVIQNMWGMTAAFDANTKAIDAATKNGLTYTDTMAGLADMNFDSLLRLHAQRWDAVRIATGNAMKPLLTALLPMTELFARMAEAVMSVPILGPSIGVIVLGVVGLVSVLGALGSTMAGLYGTFAIISQAQLLMHTRNITLMGGFKALGASLIGSLKTGITWAIGGLWSMATAAWAAVAPFWPIIAVVAVVAASAFLIIKYWTPISGFFVRLWGGITSGALQLWEGIKRVFGFSPLGMIMKNWEPIVKFFEGVWDKIGGIFERIGGWFGRSARPMTAGAMAGFSAMASPTAAPASMDSITPIERTIEQARINNSSSSRINAPITIHAAPGQNPEQIAAAVTRALEASERRAQARHRGRLND